MLGGQRSEVRRGTEKQSLLSSIPREELAPPLTPFSMQNLFRQEDIEIKICFSEDTARP